MKKSFVTIICTTITFFLCAQTPFHSTDEGSWTKYANKDAAGNIVNYLIETTTVARLDAHSGYFKVEYQMLDPNGKSVIGDKPLVMTITLDDKGGTNVLISELSKAAKSEPYLFKGAVSTLPFSLTVGEKVPDSEVKVKVGFLSFSNRITDRKVLREETITVPAGTFDCYVMEELEYTMGKKKPFKMLSWYAHGIGIIRQKLWKTDGSFYKDMVLLEFYGN